MKETFPQQNGELRNEKSVEEQANCQELPTLILIERLQNPVIREQLIQMWLENEKHKDGKERWVQDENGWVKGPDGKIIKEIYHAKTKDEVNREIEKRLTMVANDTPFDYGEEVSNVGEDSEREMIHLNTKDDVLKTVHGRAWVEAHEKGHVMRPYFAPFFKEKFGKAFDPSMLTLSHSECDAIRKDYFEKSKKPGLEKGLPEYYLKKSQLSDEEIIQKDRRENFMKPPELAERMSELKNYFGFRGDEKFTKEHLYYAKKHYVEDTGVNNGLTEWFKMITPEKEDAFIELINSAGI